MHNQNDKIYNILRPVTVNEMFPTHPWIPKVIGMHQDELAASSYLFVGPRGSGKTTLARAIANQIGSIEPIEVNTGNEKKIDDFRELEERIRMVPILSDHVAVIIDEAGEMTVPAQRMFLKVLEDSPPHLCIIMCTTDAEKLLDTFKDRCVIVNMIRLIEEQAEEFSKYMTNHIQNKMNEYPDKDNWIHIALERMLKHINTQQMKEIIDIADGSIRYTINCLYTLSVTGTLPDKINVEQDTEDIVNLMGMKKWFDIAKILKTKSITEIRKIHRSIGYKLMYKAMKSNNANNFRLLNEYMAPIEYGNESVTCLSRMAVLVLGWQK